MPEYALILGIPEHFIVARGTVDPHRSGSFHEGIPGLKMMWLFQNSSLLDVLMALGFPY